MRPTGYLSVNYPLSIGSSYGKTIFSEDQSVALIERPIPDSPYSDAISPYPLFMSPTHGQGIFREIDKLCKRKGLVTATLITAPLWHDDLREYFPNVIHSVHHIVSLGSWSYSKTLTEDTRVKYRKERKEFSIDISTGYNMLHYQFLCSAYHEQVRKHKGLGGWSDLNDVSLKEQMLIPGFFSFLGGVTEPEGIATFYRIGDDIYYHLSAYTLEGYKLGANYKLLIKAIEFFKCAGFKRIFLGGASSTETYRFKQELANSSAPSYIHMYVSDRDRYEKLSKGKPQTTYFPPYRQELNS